MHLEESVKFSKLLFKQLSALLQKKEKTKGEQNGRYGTKLDGEQRDGNEAAKCVLCLLETTATRNTMEKITIHSSS